MNTKPGKGNTKPGEHTNPLFTDSITENNRLLLQGKGKGENGW